MIKPMIYKGKETDYRISDTGVVYGKNGKQMKERYMSNGYMQICARINLRYKYIYLHRAVYETFVGEIPPYFEVNHKDGNKLNNNVSNLELTSRLENIKHSWDNDLSYVHNPHKKFHKQERLEEKYPKELIHSICMSLESPELTYADIAKIYEVEPYIVHQIANGNLWLDISSRYDIGSRFAKRSELYKKRDEKIANYIKKDYSIGVIAETLGMSYSAVARRIYLMRKKGIL